MFNNKKISKALGIRGSQCGKENYASGFYVLFGSQHVIIDNDRKLDRILESMNIDNFID